MFAEFNSGVVIISIIEYRSQFILSWTNMTNVSRNECIWNFETFP